MNIQSTDLSASSAVPAAPNGSEATLSRPDLLTRLRNLLLANPDAPELQRSAKEDRDAGFEYHNPMLGIRELMNKLRS